MQANTAQALTQVLSKERVHAYRGKPAQRISDDQLFARYAWNMAISESLYPSLQLLEVTLRNTIHQAASAHFNSEYWFDLSHILQQSHEKDAVLSAKKKLSQNRKPHDAGRIIAELNFGFWTSLFDRRYEQMLWPRLLQPAFPYLPRRMRTRANLSGRFHTIRQLRNRIFHHEPIWHWQNLEQQHQQTLEALAWIDPAAYAFAQTIDRFPDVYQHGIQPFEHQMKTL
jgi:hypothetical protein